VLAGEEWWPLVEGTLIYQFDFPYNDRTPRFWVNGSEVGAIEARTAPDGTSVMSHFRLAWRRVARSVDERSVIASLVSPSTALKDSAPSVRGGLFGIEQLLVLATAMNSFVFDYLVRVRGTTNLRHGVLNPIPTPRFDSLVHLVVPAAELVCRRQAMSGLWGAIGYPAEPPQLTDWQLAERRSLLDAEVARAYGLSLEQYAAVLCNFPLLDRSEPMLPDEPKAFVTRDLALLTYCSQTGIKPPDVNKLMREIGVDLPDAARGLMYLDDRVERYQQLGAVPYRPTPKGGRPPTDPALVSEVLEALNSDPATVSDIADALEQDETTISAVVKTLQKEGLVYREGKGKSARYYVLEDDE
jgi:DNA-binding transcriptional ArsR family regulator